MYFREVGFAANQDMYFHGGQRPLRASFTSMDTGQIEPSTRSGFAHQGQFSDGKASCTLVIAPAVARMLQDPRNVLEIV